MLGKQQIQPLQYRNLRCDNCDILEKEEGREETWRWLEATLLSLKWYQTGRCDKFAFPKSCKSAMTRSPASPSTCNPIA
jgi:hypothetical protein